MPYDKNEEGHARYYEEPSEESFGPIRFSVGDLVELTHLITPEQLAEFGVCLDKTQVIWLASGFTKDQAVRLAETFTAAQAVRFAANFTPSQIGEFLKNFSEEVIMAAVVKWSFFLVYETQKKFNVKQTKEILEKYFDKNFQDSQVDSFIFDWFKNCGDCILTEIGGSSNDRKRYLMKSGQVLNGETSKKRAAKEASGKESPKRPAKEKEEPSIENPPAKEE